MKARSRLLQLLGIALALAGLTGFWLTRDVERAVFTEEIGDIINAEPGDFKASFVIAGRDYDSVQDAGPCVKWQDGYCLERSSPAVFRYGNRTDTIIYVQVVNDKVTMISIPRDIYLPQWQAKINEMYHYQEAEGLERSVEEITGLPIDYYAIINIDIFKDLVNALGGVEVTVPEPGMYYRDAAAGLEINLDPGPQVLDGEQAAGFVRYRHTARGDYDRIDNIKALAFAMLGKLKAMNVSAASKVPELIDVVFENVDTNASVAIVRQMLPRLSSMQLQTGILPTYNIEGTKEGYDPEQVASSLAEIFGGEAKTFITPPNKTLLITNNSGKAGLEERYKSRLIGMGVKEENIVTRSGDKDATPTRILTLAESWQDADYYTTLFDIGKQQKDSFPLVEDKEVMLELVLGTDAAQNAIALP